MKRPDLNRMKGLAPTNPRCQEYLLKLIEYIESKEAEAFDFDPHNTHLDETIDYLNVGPTVKCSQCHKLHSSFSEDFFTFYGNVCIGLKGGMIGNNIVGNRVKRITILCRKPECMEYLTKHIAT